MDPLGPRPPRRWRGGSGSRLVVVTTLAALAFSLAGGQAPPLSLAHFNDVQGVTAAMTADVLGPPTSLGATGAASVTLSWTPTADGYAAGYQVDRAPASGGPYTLIASPTPVTATGYVDSPIVDGTYWYRVRSHLANWQSANTGAVSSLVTMGITGFRACAAQASETGGDGQGYEASAANGCAIDGALASDANSGTGTSTSCTSTAKDKHRFSAFGLGVPATATAIRGITVRYRAAIDAITGTNRICVQLSWNAGTSWTAAQLAPMTATGLTTYTLGGPLFLWGRSWTAAQLSDANFRLRVIDVSSNNARDFALDGVEVQVDYTP